MAVDVMRMPTPRVFAYADVEPSQSIDTHWKHPTDVTAAFTPRQSSERVGHKASVRSALNGPLLAIEDQSSASSPETKPVDRRASTVSVAADIDGITSQLDQTKIQTAALNSSKNVQVPRGFELGMAYNISNFYKQQSEARRYDKRKRDLGILPKRHGPQKHGFRPEELLWYGAVDLEDCKASDLDNEIHPLLEHDRFDDTPDHIYDQLIPGLRLASLFLTHPSCMQFWVTLAKGERRVDPVMSERYHKTRHRISRNVPMTKENVKEVIGYMEDLGRAKVIHFTFAPGLAFQGSSAFGTAHTICNFQLDSEDRRAGSVQSCHVRLHSDFYIIAKLLSTLVYPNPAQKLRFNLIVATLIVHEMAHAIELSQWRNRAPSPFEPFLVHHNDAELGRMWESYMFGGQVSPINDLVSGLYGLATWNWPRPFGEMDAERTICYSLPMKYIENIQQKKTWSQDYSLSDCSSRFHVPREGATSIYMNSVTTVSWTEEERVAKEALQEQQVQDSEEPAKKKRETADGKAMPIKDVGAKPDSDVEQLEPRKEQETTLQQLNRVKREPHGVLIRKQRRTQRKTERKAPSPKKKVEYEDLLDPDDPEGHEKPEETARPKLEIAEDGDLAVKDTAITTRGTRGTEATTIPPKLATKAKESVEVDTTNVIENNEETQKKDE
ncbi:MAG: hypothetical protein Q9213_008149 [Squamulea squamosa]